MGFLDSIREYAGSWNFKSKRNIAPEEIAEIKSAVVTPSQFGMSVCMTMLKGGVKYIPLSRDSSLAEGDVIDVKTMEIITLSKDGEKDILRVDAKTL